MIIVTFLLIWFFHKKRIDIKIEKEKPKLFGSTGWSIFFTIFFWAGTIVAYFVSAERGKSYFERHCIECLDCK